MEEHNNKITNKIDVDLTKIDEHLNNIDSQKSEKEEKNDELTKKNIDFNKQREARLKKYGNNEQQTKLMSLEKKFAFLVIVLMLLISYLIIDKFYSKQTSFDNQDLNAASNKNNSNEMNDQFKNAIINQNNNLSENSNSNSNNDDIKKKFNAKTVVLIDYAKIQQKNEPLKTQKTNIPSPEEIQNKINADLNKKTNIKKYNIVAPIIGNSQIGQKIDIQSLKNNGFEISGFEQSYSASAKNKFLIFGQNALVSLSAENTIVKSIQLKYENVNLKALVPTIIKTYQLDENKFVCHNRNENVCSFVGYGNDGLILSINFYPNKNNLIMNYVKK